MWTDPERQLAASILKNEELMAFLKKLYCPDRTGVRLELEKNVALDDATYGQIMRSLAIAEAHFATAHANIARIATKETTKKTPIAPR